MNTKLEYRCYFLNNTILENDILKCLDMLGHKIRTKKLVSKIESKHDRKKLMVSCEKIITKTCEPFLNKRYVTYINDKQETFFTTPHHFTSLLIAYLRYLYLEGIIEDYELRQNLEWENILLDCANQYSKIYSYCLKKRIYENVK